MLYESRIQPLAWQMSSQHVTARSIVSQGSVPGRWSLFVAVVGSTELTTQPCRENLQVSLPFLTFLFNIS